MGFISQCAITRALLTPSVSMNGKHSLTISGKKLITSAYSKSSNFSGFIPILQKFYEMICEIIISKTVCGIFLFFLSVKILLIILWRRTIFGNRKITKKLNISRLIYLKQNPHTLLKILFVQIIWTDFFFRKTLFSRTWSFFHDWKTTNLGAIFFHKKIILYFFSKMII